jgi:osmotically-inducible protein OsmY
MYDVLPSAHRARRLVRRIRHAVSAAPPVLLVVDEIDARSAAIPVRLRVRGRTPPVRAYLIGRLVPRAGERTTLDHARSAARGLGVRAIGRSAHVAAAARDRLTGADVAHHDEAARRRMRLERAWACVAACAAVVAGALTMYYVDPVSGRRRRALAQDKLAHVKNLLSRRLPHRAEQKARFVRGVARGIGHNAAGVVLHGNGAATDDETLVARVRSEVLRGHWVHAGEIHIDAYEGEVTLRGQLQHPDAIRRLVEQTGRVEGVRRVRSYLHLPGTLAPNKAEIFELERAP